MLAKAPRSRSATFSSKFTKAKSINSVALLEGCGMTTKASEKEAKMGGGAGVAATGKVEGGDNLWGEVGHRWRREEEEAVVLTVMAEIIQGETCTE